MDAQQQPSAPGLRMKMWRQATDAPAGRVRCNRVKASLLRVRLRGTIIGAQTAAALPSHPPPN